MRVGVAVFPQQVEAESENFFFLKDGGTLVSCHRHPSLTLRRERARDCKHFKRGHFHRELTIRRSLGHASRCVEIARR